MSEFQFHAISPVDGRYSRATKALSPYFSEAALIKYRVRVEVEYFIALCEIPLKPLADFNKDNYEVLRAIYEDFSDQDVNRVKEIESVTNHDVKAVEYFLKEKFEKLNIQKYSEFIHFGLTSQDVNNTAGPLSLKEYVEEDLIPLLEELMDKIAALAEEWRDIPMLAHTHGQPASPTFLGKEMKVFEVRLREQFEGLMYIPHTGKFGGATGNFNAHNIAFPEVNWVEFGANFLAEHLKITRQQLTTQIEHYDHMASLFQAIIRINNILLDMDRDFWTYISMNYFKQKIKEGEVGSSAMPHKVNPIDFENSEGNIGIANAVFSHLAQKLPVSRLQRDLTDSTVTRNIGVPFAHTVIAVKSLMRGLDKLLVNADKIAYDLEQNWAVVAEAIQTILRREGVDKPYEKLKDLTRKNTKINQESIHEFIDTLEVNEDVKAELKKITPSNYTGYNF